MSILYITDLDGTLLNPNICVSEKTKTILNMLIEKGMLFSIATARSPASIRGLLDGIDLRLPVVLMNGVFLYDVKHRKPMHHYSIPDELAQKALSVFQKADKCPFMYLYEQGSGIDLNFTELRLDIHNQFYNKRKPLFDYRIFKVDQYVIPKDKDVVYFNLIDRYEQLAPICSEISDYPGLACAFYCDSYSEYWFLEVFSDMASKSAGAHMIKRICRADKIVSFGDNFNDYDLFSRSDECYATGNAVDEIKEMATQVIGANFDDGVAKYLLERFKKDTLF
ncbi:MAG: HAD family hydrolase [Oscillospiraceae bacterium]|jgi:Cof subfamily protein (haloacid dehalogenase superfamily)|nr:HAD family hydrolase [Oscillospiraceae bacterium]